MKYVLGKIKLIHVLVIALFEFVSLFLIEMVGVNTSNFNPLANGFGGIIVGFFGTILLVVIFNIILDNIGVYLTAEKFSISRLRKISVTASALYCALFLCMLFFIESFTFQIKAWNILLGNAIVGLITTPLCIAITFLIYNNVAYKIRFDGQNINKIKSIKSLVIISAVYEVIALPLMAMLPEYMPRFLPQNLFILNDQITFGMVGLVSGIIGGLVAMLVYNIFLKKSIYIECKKMNRSKPVLSIESKPVKKKLVMKKGVNNKTVKKKPMKNKRANL
jgi:hypothetical protein